jgi:hypothetical protein
MNRAVYVVLSDDKQKHSFSLGVPGGDWVCLGVPRSDDSEIHRFVEY